ncbi:MAG: TlyA family RNA methyltransferase, partial [Coriobacteriia bacterium]|nr:TlyA family RNA methyltransferase [Coriobacteriia bacterium]
QRLDVALVDRGLFASRERARAAVLAGHVRVDGQPASKAGLQIGPDASIDVLETPRFVSRGGVKLEGALEKFGIDVTGFRAVDVGASTGGFTDCLLQRGATHVTAVDVGYGQLAWSLRNDARVAVLERTNIRSVEPDELGAPFDLAVVDVSFVGLSVVLPHIVALLGDEGVLVALVKPQFEVGKGRVGKKGVVRDAALHREVLERAVNGVIAQKLPVCGLTYSPITGPEGNIEFWLWAARGQAEEAQIDIDSVVREAHETLGA